MHGRNEEERPDKARGRFRQQKIGKEGGGISNSNVKMIFYFTHSSLLSYLMTCLLIRNEGSHESGNLNKLIEEQRIELDCEEMGIVPCLTDPTNI